VQRLAQIVIGSGEEQRLGAIRFLGAGARLLGENVLTLQLLDQLLVLLAQADLRDHRA
jgi:hypothetical protein